MVILRQSVDSQIMYAFLRDSSDHITPTYDVTAPTLTLSKNGSALLAFSDGSWTDLSGGLYTVTFNSTDTDTIGPFAFRVVSVDSDDFFGLGTIKQDITLDVNGYVTLNSDYDPAKTASTQDSVDNVSGNLDTLLLGADTRFNTLDQSFVDLDAKVGTPVALDGGLENLSGMLTKMADNADGVAFVAATDSLNVLATTLSGTSEDIWDFSNRSLTDRTGYSVSEVLDKINYTILVSDKTGFSISENLDKNDYTILASDKTGFSISENLDKTDYLILSTDKTGFSVIEVLDKTEYSLTLVYDSAKTAASWDDVSSRFDTLDSYLTDITGTYLENIYSAIGTPVALDGGLATISGMLTKMADDSGGALFNAATDSLNRLGVIIETGTPQYSLATGSVVTTGTVISGTYENTQVDDGSYYILAPVNPGGLDMYLTYNVGNAYHLNEIGINGRFDANIIRHVNIFAERYDTSVWEQISDVPTRMGHSTTDQNYTYILLDRYRNTENGDVKIRFYTTSTTIGDRLYLDRALLNIVGTGITTGDIANAVWSSNIATHINHDTAGFYASRSVLDHGDVVSIVDNVVKVEELRLLNDLYNGLSIEFHDEVNDVYEVRSIIDYTVDGSEVDITLDRIPFSTITSDWDAYILPNTNLYPNNVWDFSNRSLTDRTGYSVSEVLDKTEYSLTALYDAAKTAASQASIDDISGNVELLITDTSARFDTLDDSFNDISSLISNVDSDIQTFSLDASSRFDSIDEDLVDISGSIISIKNITDNIKFNDTTEVISYVIENGDKLNYTILSSDKTGFSVDVILDKSGYIVDTVLDKTNYTILYSDKTGFSVSEVLDKIDYTILSSDKTGFSISENLDKIDYTILYSDKTGFSLISAYDPATTAATQTSVNNIPANVWGYTSRSLTDEIGFTLDPADKTSIAQIVWSYATRSLTDKAGFSLSALYDSAKTAASQSSVNEVIVVTDILNSMIELSGMGGYYRFDQESMQYVLQAINNLDATMSNSILHDVTSLLIHGTLSDGTVPDFSGGGTPVPSDGDGCPFLTPTQAPGIGGNTTPIMTCQKVKCWFWDGSGANQYGDNFPFIGDGTVGRCMLREQSEAMMNSNRTQQHAHDQHKHVYQHSSSDIDPGPPFGTFDQNSIYKMPDAGVLASESTMGQDMDSNGLIYGKDFKITNDENIPPVLQGFESIPGWQNPSAEITWQEYLDGEYPRITPEISSIGRSVDTDTSNVYCILYGRGFTDGRYNYPFDPSGDPYPGEKPSVTEVVAYAQWFAYKTKWENNRENKVDYEEWYEDNPIYIKLGNTHIPMSRFRDHRFDRVTLQVTPVSGLSPVPDTTTYLDVAIYDNSTHTTILVVAEDSFRIADGS